MLTDSRHLAKRPGQKGSTVTLAAFKMVLIFSAVTATSSLSLSGPAFSPSASSPSTSRTSLPTLDPVPELPQLPLLVVLPLQPPPLPLKRSRNPSQSQRNLMTTWDSVSSIKKLSERAGERPIAQTDSFDRVACVDRSF